MRNTVRIPISLCLLLILSGCEFIGNLGASDEDRINEAIPLSADVLASKQAYDLLAASLKADTLSFNNEYTALLKLRALECGRGYKVGLAASDEDIRTAIFDKNCFSDSDEALLNWLGERRIGLMLSAPPLRPLPKTTPAILTASEFITDVDFADRAGIALIQLRKKYQVLDMVSNEIMHTADTEGGRLGYLSPNGRLLVVNKNGFAEIHDSETGSLLAKYKDVHAWEVFWINDVGALYTSSEYSNNNRRNSVFIDFSSGKKSNIPLGDSPFRVFRLPGKDLGFRAVLSNSNAELKLSKSGNSWVMKLVSISTKSSPNTWIYSSQLNSTADRLYGFQNDTLFHMSLKSMDVDTVSFHPLYISAFLLTKNPDQLYIRGYFREPPSANMEHYIYSIRNQTLASVLNADAQSFRLIYIRPLNTNAFISDSNIVFLNEFSTNGPQPANLVIQDLQQALYAAAHQRIISQPFLSESIDITRAKMVAKMQIQGGLSPAALEKVMREHNISASTMEAARRSVLAESARAARTSIESKAILLDDLAANAKIEAIGVYEGTPTDMSVAKSSTTRRTGTVHVRVVSGPRPVVLSLSAYEPVKWVVSVEPGAKLAAVLLSGYHQSEVSGIGNTPKYIIGRASPYEKTDSSYMVLKNEIMAWTGKPIHTFQGTYIGKSFSVGY